MAERKKSDYKWIIAGICFLTVMIALGLCSGNKSLYLKAVTENLGIPRSLYAIGDTFRYISTAILNLFFGVLVVKMGAKKMMVCGLAALIASTLTYAFATVYWHLWIGGFLLGVGLAWCTTTVVGYVVGKWFTENRGTVMGVILASNGLGIAISSPIVTSFIKRAADGYRTAYFMTAGLLVLVAVLILIFFREAPGGYTDNGVKPGKKKPSRGAAWVGMDMKTALRKPYFYATAFCVFLTGASLQAISGISQTHMMDVGMDMTFVGWALSIYAVVLACAKILAGVGYDHLGLRITVLISTLAGTVAIFMLSQVKADSVFLASAYELIIPFAMPMETIMLPLIAAGMFGDKCYDKVMGILVAINTAGYAVSSLIANAAYDMLGSYYYFLLALVGVMALVTVVFQLVLRRADKDKQAILAACEA